MNDDSGYQALTNLYSLSVDDINVPTLTTQNLFVDNAYIVNDTVTNLTFASATGTNLNSTNLSAVNLTASTGYIAQIGVQGITGANGYLTNMRWDIATGTTGFINTVAGNLCSYNNGRFPNLTGNIGYCNTFQALTMTGTTGFFTNLRYGAATGGNLNVQGTILSSGDISLISSGVNSEIKVLTSDGLQSRLSLKEFSDSFGFELIYDGSSNAFSLQRRNGPTFNVFNSSVFSGYTTWNAPCQFNQGCSGSTGIFGFLAYTGSTGTSTFSNTFSGLSYTGNTGFVNSLAYLSSTGNTGFVNALTYLSSTGNTGYVNLLAFQSSTGNLGFFNTIAVRDIGGTTGTFNLIRAQNIEAPVATIGQVNSGTGYFTNYLEADTRVVNNYDLCRNILRFYTENYYAGVSSPAYTDPLVFTNNFQNGLIINDSSYQSLVYLPARNGVVIPNGQPVYYYMNATLGSAISNIGSTMPSNLTLPAGNVNRTYVFIFNGSTSLYEYQGFVTALLAPTANQFNSRNNSFRLPQGRPNQSNLLSALTNGSTEWTDSISTLNIQSTGANIAFLNTTTMTGSNGFIANLNTNDTKLHLGSLAGEVAQGTLTVALGTEAGRTSQQNVGISIGYRAGNNSQGIGGIAIGSETGQTSQASNAIAIGVLNGRTSQRSNAISIGYFAGNANQNSNSIAIGSNAGATTQSSSSIAIGNGAGNTSQSIQCIAIGLDSGKCNQNSNSISIGMQSGESNQGGTTISIGFQSGQSSQQIGSIAVGDRAGQSAQQTQGLAIGTLSGASVQGTGAVAIGYLAGQTRQSAECVAIGYEAGSTSQGNDSIAIGYRAGYLNQHAQTIVMNAGTSALNTLGTGRCYINPIRLTNRTTAMRDLYYDPVISELTYSTFQDEIGGPVNIGAVYTTLFAMAGNANYLLSINTRANDGNYGLFICYQEEGANGLVVALNQNNILIQTVAGSNVQIRTVNGANYNFYYSARRLL